MTDDIEHEVTDADIISTAYVPTVPRAHVLRCAVLRTWVCCGVRMVYVRVKGHGFMRVCEVCGKGYPPPHA